MALVSREEFLSHYHHIINCVTGDHMFKDDVRLKEVFERARVLLDYTVPTGKLTRGLCLINTYLLIEYGRKNNCGESCARWKEEAFVLGWAVEIMQAFFLIADDIMDHSETRRGKPCWYKKDSVGMDAINDSFFMEQLIYNLMRHHCGSIPNYSHVFNLFHEVIYKTTMGQTLDLVTAPIGKPNLDKFSEERYMAIVEYKTAYYTIYLPIVCAMYLADCVAPVILSQVHQISLSLGAYFQIQDDYLDLYGDPEVTGKIGTDIQDNKCSWLIVQALKICSEEDRVSLVENYGCMDSEKVEKVKIIFDKLNLKQIYRDYEDQSYKKINCQISEIENVAIKDAFTLLINKLYKRSK